MKHAAYLLIVVIFTLSSCGSNDDEPQKDGTGKLSVSVGIDIKANPIGGRGDEIVPLEDFKVVIENEDGSIFIEYDRAADVPAEIELPTGIYKVLAFSDNQAIAEFENPYYYGDSELFSIDKEELKIITVTCTLANMMVTVTYSDNVVNTFDGYSTTVTSDAGGQLTFDEAEIRPTHFEVSPLTIEATLTYNKNDGTILTKAFTGAVADPQPKTHYDIQVDATIQDGQIVINLVLDESVDIETIHLGDAGSFLIITEYVEGNFGNNKYLEITNLNNDAVDLSDYQIRKYSNGNTEAQVENLSGQLGSGESIVFANPISDIYDGPVVATNFLNFNGDDALDLYQISKDRVIDIFGQIGCDPLDGAWQDGEHSTRDKTLRRKPTVSTGVNQNPSVPCSPTSFLTLVSEWDVFEANIVDDLGTFGNSDSQEDIDGDGFSIVEGDCDDTDDTVYPGAPEICGNGIDEDCDGIDESCPSDSFEPNDSFATSSIISLCSQASISLNTINDTDIFGFDAVEATSLMASVSGVPDNLMITLQLYNSTFDFEDIIQGGLGEDVALDISPGYTGTYYLQVEDNFNNVSPELFNLEICDN